MIKTVARCYVDDDIQEYHAQGYEDMGEDLMDSHC